MAPGLSQIYEFSPATSTAEVVIDFMKIRFETFDQDFILNHSGLEFQSKISHSTAEVMENQMEASFRDIKFEIRTGQGVYLYLLGSPHKLHEGGTNGGKFTFCNFADEIIFLCERLGLNPFEGQVENLEFGVNLRNQPFTPSRLINNTLYHLREKPTKSGKGFWLNFMHQQYYVKIYNKGRQLQLTDKVIRYEVKARKAIYLEGTGVYTLGDLLNPATWERLRLRLTSSVDGLLIFDPRLEKLELGTWDRKLIVWAGNPRNWDKATGPTFKNKRKRLREITNSQLPDNLQNQLRRSVDAEARSCLQYDRKTCAKLTAFIAEVAPELAPLFHRNFVTWERANLSQINSSDKGLIWSNRSSPENPEKARRCMTCGADISHRRRDAKFCEPRKCRDDYRNRKRSLKRRMDNLIIESKESLLFPLLPNIDNDRFAILLKE